jgi:aspartate kinase
MIVMKFGGTSTENAAAMRNVIRIVSSHRQDQPVVVISAIARATNELEQIARTASLGDEVQANELIESLLRRHLGIVQDLLKDPGRQALMERLAQRYREELSILTVSIAGRKQLTPRDMDAICSFGERLSSRIVALGLQEAMGHAEWVDVKDFMATDSNFGRARPVMNTVAERLEQIVRPMLVAGNIPVTQGFIGITKSGEYTTMGRESSDYSATIIGAAMGADKVQIWTDVDGILTADPRIVARTKKVRHMSFEEALELSCFGAKVLHPTTMLPVIQKQIPVQILNSKREVSTGTLISVNAVMAGGTVKAIAHRKHMALVCLSPLTRQGQYMFWAEVLGILAKHDVVALLVNTAEYHMSLLLEEKQLTDRILKEMNDYGATVAFRGKSSISLIGKGMRGATGMPSGIMDCLKNANPVMLSGPSSDTSITVVVDAEQATEALKKLHEVFIEQADDAEMFDEVMK